VATYSCSNWHNVDDFRKDPSALTCTKSSYFCLGDGCHIYYFRPIANKEIIFMIMYARRLYAISAALGACFLSQVVGSNRQKGHLMQRSSAAAEVASAVGQCLE
jgi:hypothetical protein